METLLSSRVLPVVFRAVPLMALLPFHVNPRPHDSVPAGAPPPSDSGFSPADRGFGDGLGRERSPGVWVGPG